MLNPDKLFYNVQTDGYCIKQANKAFLFFCILMAIFILINWVLVVNFKIDDFKDYFLKGTLIIIFPFRFIYIAIKKK